MTSVPSLNINSNRASTNRNIWGVIHGKNDFHPRFSDHQLMCISIPIRLVCSNILSYMQWKYTLLKFKIELFIDQKSIKDSQNSVGFLAKHYPGKKLCWPGRCLSGESSLAPTSRTSMLLSFCLPSPTSSINIYTVITLVIQQTAHFILWSKKSSTFFL